MSLLSFFSKQRYKPNQPLVNRSLFNISGGTSITPDSSMEVAAFYSGIMFISTQVAKLPWEIKNDNNENQYKHQAWKLLRLRANKEVNSLMFRLQLIQSAIIQGNGYAEIERDMAGRPIALWPIPPEYVDPYRDYDGNLVYRVIGGSLTGEGDGWIPARDMFHLRNPHTRDGIVGLGVVEYAREILGIAKGADRFSNSTYANGALPSGVLSIPGGMKTEAIERLKDSWDTAHKGRKVGGTAVLEEGVKYDPISHSPEALQMIESKKMSVLDIARFLRIPPTKLFDIEAATFNNQENSNLEVITDVLDFWARNIEMEADIKILNEGRGGLRTELDMFQVFRGDMETRSKFYSRMFEMGSIKPNEIRIKEGMSPYEDGDKYYIANNNYAPVDRLDEIIDAKVKDKGNTAANQALLNYLSNKQKR